MNNRAVVRIAASRPLLFSVFLSFILSLLSGPSFSLPSGMETGSSSKSSSQRQSTPFPVPKAVKQRFQGLRTNLEKRSIDLNLVLDGGPGKDGIPALLDPKFVPLSSSMLLDEILGIMVHLGDEKRFYPYNILVWHEIVNDTVNGTEIAVTFCPLCGSGIVFNRRVGSETLIFGVSGKLYESNLLMYDLGTESLWSQSKGEAVVGDRLGDRLSLVKMQILSFNELKKNHPDALAMSENTGFSRDYSFYPYGDYENSEKLFFPVSIRDKRFPAKELMYVFRVDGASVAFPVDDLGEGLLTETVKGRTIRIRRNGGEIDIWQGSQLLPGYYEMWFSWAVHHTRDGIVLDVKR